MHVLNLPRFFLPGCTWLWDRQILCGLELNDYGLLSKKTKNTFEVKSTHATATSTPVCTGADVCASMEVMCEGGAKRKYGLYS